MTMQKGEKCGYSRKKREKKRWSGEGETEGERNTDWGGGGPIIPFEDMPALTWNLSYGPISQCLHYFPVTTKLGSKPLAMRLQGMFQIQTTAIQIQLYLLHADIVSPTLYQRDYSFPLVVATFKTLNEWTHTWDSLVTLLHVLCLTINLTHLGRGIHRWGTASVGLAYGYVCETP